MRSPSKRIFFLKLISLSGSMRAARSTRRSPSAPFFFSPPSSRLRLRHVTERRLAKEKPPQPGVCGMGPPEQAECFEALCLRSRARMPAKLCPWMGTNSQDAREWRRVGPSRARGWLETGCREVRPGQRGGHGRPTNGSEGHTRRNDRTTQIGTSCDLARHLCSSSERPGTIETG